ncbi:protein kinase [Candidatus Woesearchaeota archaeon]|nr:protein kinase [Candidatus Woesearchaeota archaeon]
MKEEYRPKDIGEIVQDAYAGQTAVHIAGQASSHAAYQAECPADNHTIHLDLSDIEVIKERQRPKVTGKCVGNSYTAQEIFRVMEEWCRVKHHVAITEALTADDKQGGCSITYKGECSVYTGPEQALRNAMIAVDRSLEGEKALDDLKFQISEEACGRYVIEEAYAKTEHFPDSYFRDDIPRSELGLPEYWPVFGEEANFLALEETETAPGRSKPDVIVRMFSALSKIARNSKDGYFHLNPYTTEPVFVKAITKADADMIYEELHTHVMLDGRHSVPPLVAIDVIKLPNRDTPDADPEQREHTLPLLITRYIEGTTLNEHIKQKGLSERDTLSLYAKVARAVAGIHDAGITHRDIKPRNILVTPEGDVFIVDYGTATESYDTPLDAGRLNMTPYYCSPEHLECVVDPKMDIFSLGASFCDTLLGASPFHELAKKIEDLIRQGKRQSEVEALAKKTPVDVAKDLLKKLYTTLKQEAYISKGGDGEQRLTMLSDDPKKQEELEAKLQSTSEKTRDVIFKCLRGDMKDRYKDCYEIATALDEAVDYMDQQLYEIVLYALDKDPIFGRNAERKRKSNRRPSISIRSPEKEDYDERLAELVARTFDLAKDAPDNRTDTPGISEDNSDNRGGGKGYRQVFKKAESSKKRNSHRK